MKNNQFLWNLIKFNSVFICIIIFVISNDLISSTTKRHTEKSGISPDYENLARETERRANKIPRRNINKGKSTISDLSAKLSHEDRPVYILWSRWRRGSSFLGKLMARAMSGTFYSYEPMHAFGLKVFGEFDPRTRYGLKFIADIMRCNYKSHTYLFNYFIDSEFYFFNNPLTRKKCVPVTSCNDTSILEDLCNKSPMQIIKLLRLNLFYGKYFLNRHPNVKIVYLARDPRGTMKSRSRIMWCLLSKDCHDPATVCDLLTEDLNASVELTRLYPNRFFFVRYEDLARNASVVFKSIWKGLGQPLTSRIDRMIAKYTTADLENGIYGIKKNSSRNVFAWRKSLDYKSMIKIQNNCKVPMANLSYFPFTSEEEYENEGVSSMMPKWNSPLNIFNLS